jgi:hypothetical protein
VQVHSPKSLSGIQVLTDAPVVSSMRDSASSAPNVSGSLKARIKAKIRSFEITPLISLLNYLGYSIDNLTFDGYHGMESQPSLIRDIHFETDGNVRIVLYLGLAGANTTLPMYFFAMVEKGLIDARHFKDLVSFLDNILLKKWVYGLNPEKYLFLNSRETWLRAIGRFSSPASIHWLFQAIAPELQVRISRGDQVMGQLAQPAVLGQSKIGLEMIFGNSFNMIINMITVRYISETERNTSGVEWSATLMQRIKAFILPIISGNEESLEVWLSVQEPAQWLSLNAEGLQLGYEALKGDENQKKDMLIFSGQRQAMGL